jgi:high affinity sulfate transporter 1
MLGHPDSPDHLGVTQGPFQPLTVGGASLSSNQAEIQHQLRVGRPADQRGLFRWVPGLYTLRHYQPKWLFSDLRAGLVLTAVLIPVGMAYSQAAGLPAIYGLYATILPLMAYALFGPSRILVLGPDSSLAPMIAAAILPLGAGDPQRLVTAAAMLAILAGMFGVAVGLLRLGFITDLLAKPIRYGYMNGIALTVLVSQLPKLLGFSVKGEGLIERVTGLVSGAFSGRVNGVAFVLGGTTLVAILLLKRFLRIPGLLIAVGGATLVVGWLDLSNRFGVGVMGDLPRGLPAFSIPVLSLHEIGALSAAALAIVVVAFADTSVLSRIYSAKTKAYVDPNQEMIGLGVANLVSGMFQGFPVSSSSSRTPVAEASGSKSQLTGVVGALAIVVLLLFAPRLLHNLPYTALAAVVIASAIGLFEVSALRRLYRIQRWEFWLSVAAFLGVALLGPVPGMMIAIGIALAEFIWDAWRPHFAILGRAEGIQGYHDLKRYPNARQAPGLVLFRWDAPLFFANAEKFHEVVLDAVASAPSTVNWLVVAAEPVTSIDVTSVDMLTDLDKTLHKAGIELVFAEMKDPVKDKLKRFEVFQELGEHFFFPTVDGAVQAYLDAHPAVRKDWETRRPDAAGEPSSIP